MSTFFSRWLRRWRTRRIRACVCGNWQAGEALDPEQYFARGHYQVAVFMARLQLEREVGQQFVRAMSIRGDRINVRSTRIPAQVNYLANHRCVDRDVQQQFDAAYARASRVVHGQRCPKRRAESIIRQIRETMVSLSTCERPNVREEHCGWPIARKSIAGFAAGCAT